MIDLKTDGHVHTVLCNHASGSMEDYVRTAIDKGLQKLYFLEHLEVGINYFERTWLTGDDFDLYFVEGRRLRDKYGEKIFIGLGVEVGYNPDCREEVLAELSGREWDRIAVSYHFMKVGSQHYNLLSRKEYNIEALGKLGVSNVLSAYFDTMVEAVETVPAEVVCHLDAAMRYHPEVRLNEDHHKQVGKILAAMAGRGMALEVNSSGCRSRGEPFPGLDIIREAERFNIPLWAGSDAHRPEDVGSFEMLAKML